jgi:hypothetical protein
MKATILALVGLAFCVSTASAWDMCHAGWVLENCDQGASASESTWCEDMGNGGATGTNWFAGKRESMQERIARIRASIPQFSLVGLFKPSREID